MKLLINLTIKDMKDIKKEKLTVSWDISQTGDFAAVIMKHKNGKSEILQTINQDSISEGIFQYDISKSLDTYANERLEKLEDEITKVFAEIHANNDAIDLRTSRDYLLKVINKYKV